MGPGTWAGIEQSQSVKSGPRSASPKPQVPRHRHILEPDASSCPPPRRCGGADRGIDAARYGRAGAGSVTAARATAEKSWRGGRFDEIETLAQAFPKDESIAVYHALSVAARGDYARAESILKPFVAANPGGDAALETGLLQLGVGRRTEGRQTLQLILAADVRNPSARDYLRAARASRALHRIDDAQSYFRDAVGLAPDRSCA